ncbi:LamG domain-containing protein [Micromonospora craterilacus]|uniref:LamG domain-containing protein n=1 Tax=Micromonospora craterilacus TaxID=1655439 RepID=UPI001314B7B3|nr:LamG domain-containing protein [Micromonospora craterilacus]
MGLIFLYVVPQLLITLLYGGAAVPSVRSAWLSSTVASVLLAASLQVVWPPDRAAAEPADPCPVGAAPTAESEFAAQALAESCDTAVEVLAAASETTKVFAQPSGDFTLESWAEPQWAKRDGSWREIDTTLVVGTDGFVRPVASAADVVFSRGGTGAFASMTGAGASFSLGWPSTLPQGVIADDTITYPSVYPDVDLVVRAERGGFSHLLVVKSAAAADNPLVRETRYVVGGSAEVSVVDGAVTISGPDGLLAAAPPAVAWDSAPPTRTVASGARSAFLAADEPSAFDSDRSTTRGPADSATVAPVDVKVEDGSLTVAAAPEVLDAGHFPVFIDPTYDRKWASWAPVNDSRPTTQWTSGTDWPREVARVGSNYESHGDIWRSHFYFDTSALVGKRLTGAASLDAWLVHTGDCAGESIAIWQTNSLAANTPTWNGMKDKWLHDGALQTKLGKANAGCGQKADWLAFNGSQVKHHVQRHADAGHTSITFGLRMGTESGGRWAKFDPANVKLKTDYQHKPTSPVAIRTTPGGNCATSSPGPWITNRTPTLFGKANDGDGTVKIQFDLNGPTSPADHTSDWTPSGKERGWMTPTLAEGNYNWRVRGTDGVDVDMTSWTGWCYFRLDHTPPTAPVVTRTSGTPIAGQPVTLSFTSSDARSGMKQFAYGIGVDAQQQFKASTGTTTITFTPETGRTVVYVWAQDNAGNYSARTAYNFFTGRITEAQAQGAWRFDGDALDDSGQGRNFTLGTGVGYGPDRKGNANAALTFNGTGCAATSPAVRTDAEYTVAGWAKIADKLSVRALVAQGGTSRSSFYLQYNGPSDRWQLTLSNADIADATFTTISAPAATPLNAWQHVAVTVDPVAKVARLYLDGRLAAEGSLPFAPWNAQERLLVGCVGTGSSAWNQMSGSIDHLGIWQGLLSDAQIARTATELPAGPVGDWPLHANGSETTDRSSDAILPEEVDWADDQYGRAESAMVLDGTRCALTEGTVLRTDESFTVAAWVKLAAVGAGNQTVIGQDGNRVSGWYLGTRYSGGVPYWSLMMKPADDENSPSQFTRSPLAITADVGKWTHLAGVYDATAQRMSLYINGRPAAWVARTGGPWRAGGSMTIGCALYAGVYGDHVDGAISGVRVWRGALTDAEMAAVHGGNPAVKLEGMWPLDGPASDTPTYLADYSGNGRDLTITGPYSWARDRGYGRDGALGLELAANSCAESAGPVVRTDASFTVTAWVLLEQTTDHHTVVSQVGNVHGGFYLKYNPTQDRWHFGIPSTGDSTSATWHTAESQGPPELGKWTHLAGVYDVAAGKVRLYVDGEVQGEANGPASPWMAAGPTLIGCNGAADGRRWSPLGGVVDDVRIWTSTVDPDRIAGLAAG